MIGESFGNKIYERRRARVQIDLPRTGGGPGGIHTRRYNFFFGFLGISFLVAASGTPFLLFFSDRREKIRDAGFFIAWGFPAWICIYPPCNDFYFTLLLGIFGILVYWFTGLLVYLLVTFFIGVLWGFLGETDTASHLYLIAFNSITPFTSPHTCSASSVLSQYVVPVIILTRVFCSRALFICITNGLLLYKSNQILDWL